MGKMTRETVDIIRTSDGKPWTDEIAARGHQAALDYGNMLDVYEKENPSLFVNQGASGRVRGAVLPFLGWLADKEGTEFPAFEPSADEEVPAEPA
jgi:hypothetical protein